ncbi:MAG: AEC family transporter [Clostridia bacterium]|nr:AEC family transporter [Clostridia bacterium]
MFNISMTAVNAILPIVLLIVLGYVLKRIKFLTGEFLKIGNKLVFNVCLPAMLFVNVYSIGDLSDVNWGLIIYCVVAIFIIYFIGLLVSILTTKDNRRRGVILQCTYRSNFAIIGVSLAASLAGTAAGAADTVNAVVAIIQALAIPIFNILAVISLSIFTGQEGQRLDENGMLAAPVKKHTSVKKILLGIVKNPLIIAIFSGLVCVGIRYAETAIWGYAPFTISDDLSFLYRVLTSLKSMATPLALIVLGGQFEFSAVRGMTKEIVVATVFRLIIAPLIGVGGAVLLSECTSLVSFGQTEYPALIALFGTPVAVSSAIMAGEMGADDKLAGQLVVWTSICSIFTLFMTVFLLMTVGLLAV